jgi:hypothetical protein
MAGQSASWNPLRKPKCVEAQKNKQPTLPGNEAIPPLAQPPPKYSPPNSDAYYAPLISMPEGNVNAPLHEMDPSQYDKQPNLVPRPQRLFDDLPDHGSAEREKREYPGDPVWWWRRRRSQWTEEQ